jgi:hypothetical protein
MHSLSGWAWVRRCCGLVVLLVLAVGLACGGDRSAPATPAEADAAAFALARFGEWDRQEYGKAWAHLHPAQQAIVPRAQFTWCYGERNGDSGIKEFELSGEITHATVRIPGTGLDADATIVPIKLVSESGDGDARRPILHRDRAAKSAPLAAALI